MRHREIIPTDDHQTGHPNRRVAAQINLRQGHWADAVVVARTEEYSLESHLLRQLPNEMIVELAKRLCRSPRFDVETDDWLAVNEELIQPTVFARIEKAWIGLLAVLAVAAAGVALTRAVGTLIGWWAWGSRWMAVAVLVSTVVAPAALFVSNYLSKGKIANMAAATGTISLLAALSGAWLYFGVTAVEWLGWSMAIALYLAIAAVGSFVDDWLRGRERALENPYRAILRADTGRVRPGHTVIARAGRRPGAAATDALAR